MCGCFFSSFVSFLGNFVLDIPFLGRMTYDNEDVGEDVGEDVDVMNEVKVLNLMWV